ncbi:MAG TPA: DUF3667 domain-containing protein [Geothrix sp.]|nr:DUF3667 domain-containing protein [Geothrix sp.]
MSSDPSISCSNCGTALAGAYCHACGEKQRGPHALDLGPFLHELFHFETHLDNTLIRTLRPLVLEPGFLTKAWIEGRRVAFAKPIQLFVVLNLLFFIAAPHLGLFGWRLEDAMRHAPQGRIAQLAHQVAEQRDLPMKAVAYLTDLGMEGAKRSLFLVLIPVLALLLKILHPRRRLVEHIVFAIHHACFVFILLLASVLLLSLVLFGMVGSGLGDAVTVPLFLGGMAAYHWISIGKVYGGSVWRRGFESLLLAASFLPLIGAVERVGFRWVLHGLMH